MIIYLNKTKRIRILCDKTAHKNNRLSKVVAPHCIKACNLKRMID